MEFKIAVNVLFCLCEADTSKLPAGKIIKVKRVDIQEVLPQLSVDQGYRAMYVWTDSHCDRMALETFASENAVMSQIGRMVFEGNWSMLSELIAAAEAVYGEFNLKKVNYLSTEKGTTPSEEFSKWIIERGGQIDYDKALAHRPFVWHRYLLDEE